jgi:hypothetical protein
LEAVLREFNHEIRGDATLRRKLSGAGQKAGPDGKYSTKQIVDAIYTDAFRERPRGCRERADNWSLRNGLLRAESLSKAEVVEALGQVFAVIEQLVRASSMSAQEKRDAIDAISTWRAAVERVSEKASRQISTSSNGANGHNGDADDNEADEED